MAKHVSKPMDQSYAIDHIGALAAAAREAKKSGSPRYVYARGKMWVLTVDLPAAPHSHWRADTDGVTAWEYENGALVEIAGTVVNAQSLALCGCQCGLR